MDETSLHVTYNNRISEQRGGFVKKLRKKESKNPRPIRATPRSAARCPSLLADSTSTVHQVQLSLLLVSEGSILPR